MAEDTAEPVTVSGDWRLPPFLVQSVFVSATPPKSWGVVFLGIPQLQLKSRGAGVTVCVIDTGAPSHAALAGQLAGTADFSGSHYGTRDVQGHSTHCCGVVSMIAPECKLLTAKVLGDDGSGSSEQVAAGIRWAADQGASVLSMSLGAPTPDGRIHEAVRYAESKGCFLIAAAGNSGPGPGTLEYPGAWSECVSVGAIDETGKVASFSSRGAELDCVAPGVGVVSCWLNNQWAKLSGSSMATPHVAGLVALARAYHQDRGRPWVSTAHDLIELLQRTCRDIGVPGFDPETGYGIPVGDGLFEDAANEPPAGSGLTFTAEDFTAAGKAKLRALLGDHPSVTFQR